jgi:hypothetical protein|tara:strand:+ start:1040 stop:1222 length:183 start_codon:yes stop_codon:yes gene_type:complete
MIRKIYKVRIVIDKDGEVEEICESLDYDKTKLYIRGVDVTKYLDDESVDIIQGCTEVALS